mmetsp:Transcript_48422/g.142923  ORF Transcript_48422/g.142923 Transcript_48422/m.142923 type:complete len:348 (-) Transcript_48422:285-1328(-)
MPGVADREVWVGVRVAGRREPPAPREDGVHAGALRHEWAPEHLRHGAEELERAGRGQVDVAAPPQRVPHLQREEDGHSGARAGGVRDIGLHGHDGEGVQVLLHAPRLGPPAREGADIPAVGPRRLRGRLRHQPYRHRHEVVRHPAVGGHHDGAAEVVGVPEAPPLAAGHEVVDELLPGAGREAVQEELVAAGGVDIDPVGPYLPDVDQGDGDLDHHLGGRLHGVHGEVDRAQEREVVVGAEHLRGEALAQRLGVGDLDDPEHPVSTRVVVRGRDREDRDPVVDPDVHHLIVPEADLAARRLQVAQRGGDLPHLAGLCVGLGLLRVLQLEQLLADLPGDGRADHDHQP